MVSSPRARLRAVPAARLGASLLFSALALLAGCQPQIGDDCRRDLECSQLGDRMCDTSQPGGYCTIANCTPTSCPAGQAICVAFNNEPSSVPGCRNVGRTSPYVRNFCMKNCSEDSDCRSGYVCVDLSQENPWNADVIQRDSEATSVCLLPASDYGSDIDPDRKNEVCVGASAGGAGSGSSSEGGSAGAE